MWTDVVVGCAAGAAVGVVGSLAVEGFHLALRRNRNAPFVAAGDPPWKDEVFRPKWGLLGAAGAIAGAVVSGFGASWPILIGVALVPALALALLGVEYLRR